MCTDRYAAEKQKSTQMARVDASGMQVEKQNVIDEILIRESVQVEQKMQKEERSQKQPEFALTAVDNVIDVTAIKTLTLSFKSILQINNLKGLQRLTELRLDNNSISKIENLSCLPNLTWLDLSFNNIEKIEGLDALTKLTDLSLFNNKIQALNNLDMLTNLQVLSVGNNKIDSVDRYVSLTKNGPFVTVEVVHLHLCPLPFILFAPCSYSSSHLVLSPHVACCVVLFCYVLCRTVLNRVYAMLFCVSCCAALGEPCGCCTAPCCAECML
jgi:hypothetical protein